MSSTEAWEDRENKWSTWIQTGRKYPRWAADIENRSYGLRSSAVTKGDVILCHCVMFYWKVTREQNAITGMQDLVLISLTAVAMWHNTAWTAIHCTLALCWVFSQAFHFLLRFLEKRSWDSLSGLLNSKIDPTTLSAPWVPSCIVITAAHGQSDLSRVERNFAIFVIVQRWAYG